MREEKKIVKKTLTTVSECLGWFSLVNVLYDAAVNYKLFGRGISIKSVLLARVASYEDVIMFEDVF